MGHRRPGEGLRGSAVVVLLRPGAGHLDPAERRLLAQPGAAHQQRAVRISLGAVVGHPRLLGLLSRGRSIGEPCRGGLQLLRGGGGINIPIAASGISSRQ